MYAWMCVSSILKQTHFEGRQCSKIISILMVTCGKHTGIEGLFPVVLKTNHYEFEWYILYSYTDLYVCTKLITVYEPETKYGCVLYSLKVSILTLEGLLRLVEAALHFES